MFLLDVVPHVFVHAVGGEQVDDPHLGRLLPESSTNKQQQLVQYINYIRYNKYNTMP